MAKYYGTKLGKLAHMNHSNLTPFFLNWQDDSTQGFHQTLIWPFLWSVLQMCLKPISCWLSVRKTTYINQGGPDFFCEAVAILCGDPHFRQCLRVPICPVILNLPREDPNLPMSQFLANNILIWISYWFCFSGWTLAATLLFVLPSFCLSFPSVKQRQQQ